MFGCYITSLLFQNNQHREEFCSCHPHQIELLSWKIKINSTKIEKRNKRITVKSWWKENKIPTFVGLFSWASHDLHLALHSLPPPPFIPPFSLCAERPPSFPPPLPTPPHSPPTPPLLLSVQHIDFLCVLAWMVCAWSGCLGGLSSGMERKEKSRERVKKKREWEKRVIFNPFESEQLSRGEWGGAY